MLTSAPVVKDALERFLSSSGPKTFGGALSDRREVAGVEEARGGVAHFELEGS